MIFSRSSWLVLPFWLLMVFVPRWSWTQRIMQSPLVVVASAVLYTVLVIPMAGVLLPVLMRPSLSSVAILLATPAGATIGWVHFLAFDLFVGRWIYLDSQERGITSWAVSPILLLTFLFGPLGFVSYMGVRIGYMLLRARMGQAGREQVASSAPDTL
jgi:hypothetical protein